ncbi:MAG: pilus assembly protein PilM [Planctomycetes bacterium]|nr:pilus assembly protein PilM [Planctomycetota bacterium]
MLFARRSPIAVDLGTRAVKLLQLVQRHGELFVQDAVCVEIEPGARDDEERARRAAHALKLAYRRGEFRGREAIGAIPLERTTTRSLRVPRHELEDLQGTIARDADELFGAEAAQYAAQWLQVGERIERGEHRTEILCCYAPQAAIRENLACFAEIGLAASALDLDACAMARPFARRGEGSLALLELGVQSSRVCLLRDGEPVLVRVLTTGGEALLARLRERLHLDRRALEDLAAEASSAEERALELERAFGAALEGPLEALAGGLSECLRYATASGAGRGVERVLLVGGAAEIPQLAPLLGARLQLAVEVGDPFRAIGATGGLPQSLRRGRSAYATALGLALRGLAA